MSSGTNYQPDAGRNASIIGSSRYLDFAEAMQRIQNLGFSPRAQELNFLWSWYKTVQYDGRKYDWDGHPNISHVAREQITQQGFVPAGYVLTNADWPQRFRRPKVIYNIVKVIVDRFTGMLFSERRHPQLDVLGEPSTDDYLDEMVKQSRLWATMIQARQHGGSMGTCIVGFKFIRGKPICEVHDPRWTTVKEWADRTMLEPRVVEKRYMHPEQVRDPNTGQMKEVAFWYRRMITDVDDVLFKPVPVEDGREPEWQVQEHVKHDFGFCPVQWIQNLPVEDSIDGDPDVLGIHGISEGIDQLLSESFSGTAKNCDPTLVLRTKGAITDALKKGSDNALKVDPEGGATYLEIAATGIKSARELAQEMRTFALEVAQCVLDHPDAVAKTATEIELVYSSMLSKADVLREQYGERGVKPLATKFLRAARHVTRTVVVVPEMPQQQAKLGGGNHLEKWRALVGKVAEQAGRAAEPSDPAAPRVDAEPPPVPPGANTPGQDEISAEDIETPTSMDAAPNSGEAPQPQPQVQRGVLALPPRVINQPDGSIVIQERALGRIIGEEDYVEIIWPNYFEPTLTDAQTAVGVATSAVGGKLMTQATAVEFVAPYLRISDPKAEAQALAEEEIQAQADLQSQALSGMAPMPPGADPNMPPDGGEEPPLEDPNAPPPGPPPGVAP